MRRVTPQLVETPNLIRCRLHSCEKNILVTLNNSSIPDAIKRVRITNLQKQAIKLRALLPKPIVASVSTPTYDYVDITED